MPKHMTRTSGAADQTRARWADRQRVRRREARDLKAIERRARALAAADRLLSRLADELGLDDETRAMLGIAQR